MYYPWLFLFGNSFQKSDQNKIKNIKLRFRLLRGSNSSLLYSQNNRLISPTYIIQSEFKLHG